MSYHNNLTEEQKQVRRDRTNAWNKAHPERVKRNQRLHLARRKAKGIKKKPMDKQKNIESQRRHHAKYPWSYSMNGAKQRCTNPKATAYHRYGGRGIRFEMTHADFRFLWNRDNADKMDHPSIDRKNNEGNYTLDNCQFIEWKDNSRKVALDRLKAKGQPTHFIDKIVGD